MRFFCKHFQCYLFCTLDGRFEEKFHPFFIPFPRVLHLALINLLNVPYKKEIFNRNFPTKNPIKWSWNHMIKFKCFSTIGVTRNVSNQLFFDNLHRPNWRLPATNCTSNRCCWFSFEADDRPRNRDPTKYSRAFSIDFFKDL